MPLEDIWKSTIIPFYETNNRVLYARQLDKGKAFLQCSIPKYLRPKILFRAFVSSESGQHEANKYARVIMQNAACPNHQGGKNQNMQRVANSLNQDCFSTLEHDLYTLFCDSVAVCYYREKHIETPNIKKIDLFREEKKLEINNRLLPKLTTLASILRENYRDTFQDIGLDGHNITKNNAVKCLTLLIAIEVSQLEYNGNPSKELTHAMEELKHSIERYRALIPITAEEVSPQMLASNAIISPGEDYVQLPLKLQELKNYFCAQMSDPKIALIYGMSGSGKSVLAKDFARSVASKYDTIQWTYYTPDRGFHGILEQIFMKKPDATWQEKVEALRSDRQKNLIIIDNFDEQCCTEPLPQWGSTHLLFTSRSSSSEFNEIIGAKVHVNCTKELSLQIFKSVFSHICKRHATEYQTMIADRILQKVNYHTYATNLLAREIAQYYSEEKDIDKYEAKIAAIWKTIEVESRKDTPAGTAPKSATFDHHIRLLFKDLLSCISEDPLGKALMYLLTLHNRWSKNTLCLLLGDDISQGKVRASATIAVFLRRNYIQSELFEDKYYGKTTQIITAHPLVQKVLQDSLSWDDAFEIPRLINNFCSVWTNPGYSNGRFWVDQSHWPAVYKDKVDSWLSDIVSSYLSGTQPWNPSVALAICFMMQPFFVKTDHVETIKNCLCQQAGLSSQDAFFLCSCDTNDCRNFFVYFPESKHVLPLLSCKRAYADEQLDQEIQVASPGNWISIRSIIANQEHLIIPGTLNGLPVKDLWFVFDELRDTKNNSEGTSKLWPKTVTIDNGIQEIHQEAFSSTRIEEVSLPASIGIIEEQAFADNMALRRVDLPNNLTRIPAGCFHNCPSLKTINLPETIKTIERYAFSLCDTLSHINFPSSLVFIEDGAFYGCDALLSVSFPSALQSVGEEAFGFCSSLNKVIIASDNPRISKRAFVCCASLEKVAIHGADAFINPAAFLYCPHLKEIFASPKWHLKNPNLQKNLLLLASVETDQEIDAFLRELTSSQNTADEN